MEEPCRTRSERTPRSTAFPAIVTRSPGASGRPSACASPGAAIGLGLDGEHALEQITAMVHEAACPVIALLDAEDTSYVNDAARRGVFAYVVLDDDESAEIQGALEITLRRFAEFQDLQGAFGRRAIIEQAKGILMERNRIDADAALALLKSHSQRMGQRVNDVAEAITQTYQLLPSTRTGAAGEAD